MNREAILTYISSSEINRCKKNGLNLLEPRKLWIDVLSYPWLTRKLRRKVGRLFQMGLLPIMPQRVAGLFMPLHHATEGHYEAITKLHQILSKQFLKIEDEAIMKGVNK